MKIIKNIYERIVTSIRRVPIIGKFATHIVMIAVVIFMGAPILWVFSTALKPFNEIFVFPPVWIPKHIEFNNFVQVWTRFSFPRYFLNSLIVAGSVLIMQMITCSLSAYAFSWLNFPGRDILFLAFLATMMIPEQVRIVPSYIILSELKWIDTLKALSVPFFASAFGTFLIRQNFLSIPSELIDAAKIDGANHLQILTKCLIPLSKPTYITFMLLSFTWRWNDYFWALIMTNSNNMRTLPVGLVALRHAEGSTQWNLIMAGTVITLVPIFILFLTSQKFIIEGIARTGIKG